MNVVRFCWFPGRRGIRVKMKSSLVLAFACVLGLCARDAEAAENTGYRLTAPGYFPIFNTASPTAWTQSNGVSVVWTAGGSAKTNDPTGNPTNPWPYSIRGPSYPQKDGYRLVESSIGSPFEHIRPEYYLGDYVGIPSNVNWAATLAALTNSADYLNHTIFYDASSSSVIFSGGGLVEIAWVINHADGLITNNHTYVVGGLARTKPYRIFWTDEPYNCPPVDLTGKFVKFFGDTNITKWRTGVTTNMAGGVAQPYTNVVSGLFLDTATHWLQARGHIRGQVVMAYYDTGLHDNLLGTIVVEVGPPEKQTVPGPIGEELRPTGDGYDPAGLDCMVSEGLTGDDDDGAYVYQHKGNYSYSPKNGKIYAVRSTVGEPWKIEVVWRHKDFMATSWPFEVLNYLCDWPADAVEYVRGNLLGTNGSVDVGLTIPIPSDYTATLMPYQDPPGHAILGGDSVYFTRDNGYSLLQLKGDDDNGDDNVWFIPVHSISRDEPRFDLTAEPWPVGVEVAPLPTALSLFFDGASAYLRTSLTNLPGDSFTVETYFQMGDNGGANQTLFFKSADAHSATNQLDFKVAVANGRVQAVVGTTTATWVSSEILNEGWNHVALVYDEAITNYTLLVNGGATSNRLTRAIPSAGALYFGLDASNSNNPGYFSGYLDDIRVWNRALTQAEITSNLFVGFLHGAETNTQLAAYYPVEDGVGRILMDTSTNRLHADMVNCTRAATGAIGMPDVSDFDRYHGYIYEPNSGNNFNPLLYRRADATDTNQLAGAMGSGTNESYIFAINSTDKASQPKPLEIWWAKKEQQSNMPDPIWFPGWVQRYRFGWLTNAYSYPAIALASQLGSLNTTYARRGVALDFGSSVNSRMSIDEGRWFSGDSYTVECWVKPHSLTATAQVFDFGNADSANRVSLQILTNGLVCYGVYLDATHSLVVTSSTALAHREGWNHLALVVSNGLATLYLDGKTNDPSVALGFDPWSETVTTTNNLLGVSYEDGTASLDGQLAEFAIWGVARSADEIYHDGVTPLTGNEDHLRLYYSFAHDLRGETTVAGVAYDRVGNVRGRISAASWSLPGAPQLANGVLMSQDAPFVYAQNDPAQPGYNPNEEHAFIRSGAGGYITYALRSDLNQGTNSSDPYVLVQYTDLENQGRPNMAVYQVVPTNQFYPAFAATNTAGLLVPGPNPLLLLPDPWNTNTYWKSPGFARNSPDDVGYRDRKLQIWAKRAGTETPTSTTTFVMHNFYPMQDGFYFPSLGTNQPPLNQPVPWLSWLTNASVNVLTGDPAPWTWTVKWPDGIPTLDIGQTLTKAKSYLPEVWAAKNMKVVFAPKTNSVALFDPVVIQSVGLDYEGNFAEYFDLDTGPRGTILLKNGKTYFKNVPPNVSDRLYFDPSAAKSNCLKLLGRLVEHPGGLSYLQLNVLNEAERAALTNVVTDADTKGDWMEAIEKLATNRVAASDTKAVVNYALTHMGPGGGGYVTLVENDTTNAIFGVRDGDAINMHIIKISTNLYAGNLLPVEDPNNLLSEQLDILYTESFAGTAGEFEFQWKRAEPNADGTTPTNYVDQFDLYRQSNGLTRFTIGKEGDTLPDMVNNFYVMRYRATTNSEAYEITDGVWSKWITPTLAEGWVQRVLNNVTPFTQRMQDLYSNPAETTVSMIQQAGAPYEGDVALNQENLNNIGLIQLYQTVLNKAESMSIRLGINDTAANQQLMLAATRLNDLYMLLGNEAYADAMDPTIGFGSDFYNSGSLTLAGVDYGSLSSSLFCFDNLCPNLRSEELALLRGRSDQLAPTLTWSPTYNRLYWNFTKGITAGEVAYAMNYQIQGDDPTIDQPQAAVMYPQGHGDAWGHYLSALDGYYRLMRNPYFSWGTPSITPMMVGDAVVDADYYDEEKFAESAAAMARTAVEVIKRTCEQSYVENNGKTLTGYLDSNTRRAFGYGEWGARAGLMSLYNWAAANSLLPPQLDPADYEFLTFATNTQLSCEAPSTKVNFSGHFTVEFNLNPSLALQDATGPCALFDWYYGTNFDRTYPGSFGISLDPTTTNLVLAIQDSATNRTVLTMAAPPYDAWSHVAITYDRVTSTMTLYLDGAVRNLTNVAMSASSNRVNAVLRLAANDAGQPFAGALSEFRVWTVVRPAADLVADRAGVSATDDGLVAYQRFMSETTGSYLQDEASSATWLADHPVWTNQTAAGASLAFVDKSILRINRESVGSLGEISAALKDLQHTVDLADAGLTPIGLSDSAIPFDIDPSELANGKSHFEQIAERAEMALGNAATLLNRAQSISRLQRQQTQSAINMKQDLDNEELALTIELIGIYGYPYSGDIGAGGTYGQGYDGPDLFHYMWMNLESYGFKHFEIESETNVMVMVVGTDIITNFPSANTPKTLALRFDFAANGMILKPDEIQGTRRAQGRIQAAYGTFIQTYLEYRKALLTYDEAIDHFNAMVATCTAQAAFQGILTILSSVLEGAEIEDLAEQIGNYTLISSLTGDVKVHRNVSESVKSKVDNNFTAGMSFTIPGGAIVKVANDLEELPREAALTLAIESIKTKIEINKTKMERMEKLFEIFKGIEEYVFETAKFIVEAQKTGMEANEAAQALDVAYAAMINAQEVCQTVMAEGEQLQARREALRKQGVNRIAAGRYQDMAFRTFRTDALANYGNAFALAKKYTYLATKAYDYETALGLTNAYGTDSIFSQIVGARTLGFMDDGVAQLGGLHGDGGLADVLARLKANWIVLEGRLGINNPQIEQNWLSLRSECFRIPTIDATGWKNKLQTCVVDDLLAYPEFQRYCQSFESSTGLLPQEPGLVIPFSTSIDFANNAFGLPLEAYDHAFDSSYYATKIRKVGVRLVNPTNGVLALTATPRVYLIPVGHDVMRSPGSLGGDLLAYSVVDQVVPLPFPLGTSSLDEPDWTSVYTAYTGAGDPMATIRRYPSMLASYSSSAEPMLSNTRLVGRSVWNSRWLLVIPAGALLNDRDLAIRTLIGDGTTGVQDIQIGFETYSHSGN